MRAAFRAEWITAIVSRRSFPIQDGRRKIVILNLFLDVSRCVCVSAGLSLVLAELELGLVKEVVCISLQSLFNVGQCSLTLKHKLRTYLSSMLLTEFAF